jgi:hypothetical protein
MISSFDEDPEEEILFVKYHGIAFQIVENSQLINFAIFMDKMYCNLTDFIKRFTDKNNFS